MNIGTSTKVIKKPQGRTPRCSISVRMKLWLFIRKQRSARRCPYGQQKHTRRGCLFKEL